MAGYWERRAFEVIPAALKLPEDDLRYIGYVTGDWSWGRLSIAMKSSYVATLVPALVKALRDYDPRVCRRAAEALGRIGGASFVSHSFVPCRSR